MSNQIKLRDVRESDLAVFYEQQRDEDAAKMAAFPSRDLDDFMAHWRKALDDKANTMQAIDYGDEVAGNIVSWTHGEERNVGYWIGKEFWGKGIATEALAMFLQQVVERPLYAHVAKHNVASIRVLEKCGFVRSSEAKYEDGVDGQGGEEWIMILRQG